MKRLCILVALLIFVLPAGAWCKVVYVSAGGSGDGSSWASPMKSIQAAINSCTTGDQVWVKSINNSERIRLKPGVAVFGGFRGDETSLAERVGFPRHSAGPTHSTISGSFLPDTGVALVTCESGAGPNAILDGFWIVSGKGHLVGDTRYGGGIYIDSASPTIRNCQVSQCEADEGGGIYCSNSSAVLERNDVYFNSAKRGAGIHCVAGSPRVVGNRVTLCTSSEFAAGIYLHWSEGLVSGNIVNESRGTIPDAIRIETAAPTRPTYVTNNTVHSNEGVGIRCIDSNCWVYNNIVYGNKGYGISRQGGTVSAGGNNVYGFPSTNYYDGIPAPSTDIHTDPGFYTSYYNRSPRLAAGSPCIDTGTELSEGIWARDVDNQPRRNGTVDIGADEYYPIIYVSTTGSDWNGGTSWTDAKRTIECATPCANGPIWVAKGTYRCNLRMGDSAMLYGGFAGTETSLSQRPAFPRGTPDGNETILDGGAYSCVVSLQDGRESVVDGFTITNGAAQEGAGLDLWHTDTIITNNKITGNAATSRGGGIYLLGFDGQISRNTISNNSAAEGGGMWIGFGCEPVLVNNSIADNSATSRGGGIYGWKDWATVMCNDIVRNSAPSGAGIYLDQSRMTLKSNLLFSNDSGAGIGAGVFCSAGIPTIASNTFCRNTAANGGGLACVDSSARIANNIIALNSSGIHNSGGSPRLTDNCISRNTSYNYGGVGMGRGDITADPQFLSEATNDFRLAVTSPCVNSGSNSFVLPEDRDRDGRARIFPAGSTTDMGAFELRNHPVYSPSEARQLVTDGVTVYLATRGPMICTGSFGTYYYVESSDRLSGIKCMGTQVLSLGQTALVTGVMATVNGERTLTQAAPYNGITGIAEVPAPYEVVNRNIGGGDFGRQSGVIGGVGLNNIGLLVRTTGRVISTGEGSIVIDDGTGGGGVKVYLVKGIKAPPQNAYISVTGISSTEPSGGGIARVIRACKAGDVVRLL